MEDSEKRIVNGEERRTVAIAAIVAIHNPLSAIRFFPHNHFIIPIS
jgi:hypothetical protein